MKYLLMLPLLFLILAGIGCEAADTTNGGTTAEDIGTLTLNITDAPVDVEAIAGVWISITRVEIGKTTGESVEWEELADYSDDPVEINLLDYTNGLAYEIGNYELAAGQYNQIRFYLDAPEEGQGAPTSPGCYVEFTDQEAENEPLFVPSGSQSGYKALGSFEIPENGDVEVTIDFDVRKSLHKTGGEGAQQRYLLKPTLRLIVDSNAGSITGTIDDQIGLENLVAYAYEDGDWIATEYAEPEEGESYFPNAVSSSNVELDTETWLGDFTLAYLSYDQEEGTIYDVIIVAHNEDGSINEILIVLEDVTLDSNTENVGTLNTDDYTPIIPGV